jgi:hypothetical protein
MFLSDRSRRNFHCDAPIAAIISKSGRCVAAVITTEFSMLPKPLSDHKERTILVIQNCGEACTGCWFMNGTFVR